MASILSPFSDDSSEPPKLARWLKPDGGFVLIDEPIAEIETARASIDIPAWATGTLRHIAQPGDPVTKEMIKHKFTRIERA